MGAPHPIFPPPFLPQRNRKRRNRKKKKRPRGAREGAPTRGWAPMGAAETTEPEVEVEYITEEPEIYDPNFVFFKRIFEAFKVPGRGRGGGRGGSTHGWQHPWVLPPPVLADG